MGRHPIVVETGPVVEVRPVDVKTLVGPAGSVDACTHQHMVLE